VRKAARSLGEDEWQFRARGRSRGIAKENRHGEVITRLVDGACIFLNRPGFDAGAGCALHQAALRRGREPLELKPDVCWQLPLRREDTVDEAGHVTSTVRQWDRKHWGPGGDEFHWWCTESPEAFVGRERVHDAMAAELRELVGATVYEMLRAALAERMERGTPLPHPVVRRR
jgi:hypothetical protein